ncbi:MAG: cytochrome c3 family protein [Candidatus Omnitrophota bacterium]|nr:cytochrome c3 family protein [Candidatus Omnitrophota bacterium]
MSKNFLIGLLVLAVSLIAGDLAFAKITGSGHDFSSQAWELNQEICFPCHIPHNAMANTGQDRLPLWNHALTTATFITYSSDTLVAEDVGQPSSSSKVCLSCHDGTVALNAFGGSTGSSTFAVGPLKVGTDLSHNHPVSFTYTATLVNKDGGLNDPSTSVSALGGQTIDSGMLIKGKVECSSCHDVHAAKGNAQTDSRKLLVVSMVQSELCLTCHKK